MEVHNFNVFRTCFGPAEADLELLVDSDTVLASTTSKQRLQHVTGRYFEIIQLACGLKSPKF